MNISITKVMYLFIVSLCEYICNVSKCAICEVMYVNPIYKEYNVPLGQRTKEKEYVYLYIEIKHYIRISIQIYNVYFRQKEKERESIYRYKRKKYNILYIQIQNKKSAHKKNPYIDIYRIIPIFGKESIKRVSIRQKEK